jgi:hypothetical protein
MTVLTAGCFSIAMKAMYGFVMIKWEPAFAIPAAHLASTDTGDPPAPWRRRTKVEEKGTGLYQDSR